MSFGWTQKNSKNVSVEPHDACSWNNFIHGWRFWKKISVSDTDVVFSWLLLWCGRNLSIHTSVEYTLRPKSHTPATVAVTVQSCMLVGIVLCKIVWKRRDASPWYPKKTWETKQYVFTGKGFYCINELSSGPTRVRSPESRPFLILPSAPLFDDFSVTSSELEQICHLCISDILKVYW